MSELDFQKRLGYYKMAESIIMEVGGWITAYTSNFIRARRKELLNMPIDPSTICDMSICWKSA
jgi:hypothetical protein